MGCVNVLMKGDAHPTKMDKYHMMLIIDGFFYPGLITMNPGLTLDVVSPCIYRINWMSYDIYIYNVYIMISGYH